MKLLKSVESYIGHFLSYNPTFPQTLWSISTRGKDQADQTTVGLRNKTLTFDNPVGYSKSPNPFSYLVSVPQSTTLIPSLLLQPLN